MTQSNAMRVSLRPVAAALHLAALAALPSAQAGLFGTNTPGTPKDVVTRVDSTNIGSGTQFRIFVTWTNTAGRDELVEYELDQKVGDTFTGTIRADSMSGTGNAWSPTGGYRFDRAEPETNYCFRVWSRYVDNGVRSMLPSAWACAQTPPLPPLKPLDVRARVPSTASTRAPIVSWSTPDQSNRRPIKLFRIARQSPPGPNRPWIEEGVVAGPGGAQSASTRLALSFAAAAVDPNAKHAYRVCAENEGGSACADPVPLTTAVDTFAGSAFGTSMSIGKAPTSNASAATQSITANEQAAAAVRAAPALPAPTQRAAVSAAKRAAASTPPAPTPVAAPAAAPLAPPRAVASTAPAGTAVGRAQPAAPAHFVVPEDLARHDDNAIIIVGGRSVRAGELKREVLALDDNAIIIVGGRQERAALLKQQLRQTPTSRYHVPTPGAPTSATAPFPQPQVQSTTTPHGAPGSALQR
jgi:hypothetical protein